MKMKLMVLRKVTEHSGRKIDTYKLTWEDWKNKLNEEVDELVEALHSKNKIAIMEEVLDVIQVCVGIIAKLFKEGMVIEQGIYKHNKKLVNRGCEAGAEVKFSVIRK